MNTLRKYSFGLYFAYIPVLFYALIGSFLRTAHLVYTSQVFIVPEAYMSSIYWIFWAFFILNFVVLDDMGYERPWFAIYSFIVGISGPTYGLYVSRNLLDSFTLTGIGLLIVYWMHQRTRRGPSIDRMIESLSVV